MMKSPRSHPFSRPWWRRLSYACCSFILVLLVGLHPIAALHALAPQTMVEPPRLPEVLQAVPANRFAWGSPLIVAASPLWQQGYDAYQAGRYTEAITIWQQVVQTHQRQGNALQQALVLNHLSTAYQQLHNWSAAEATLQTSVALLANLPHTPAVQQVQAQALNTQGTLQLAQGQTEAALQTWQQAAPLYTKLQDPIGAVGNHINQAQAHHTLGAYATARKMFQQLQAELAQITAPDLRLAGLQSLGNSLYLIGNYREARSTLNQSLQLARTLNATPSIPAIQLSLGNIAYAEGRWAVAQRLYQRASHSNDLHLQRQAKLNLLAVLVEQLPVNGQSKPQINTLWPDIAAQLATAEQGRDTVYDGIRLARLLAQFKSKAAPPDLTWTQIAQWMRDAQQLAQTLADPWAESYALGHLGHLYELNQQWDDAIQVTEQALQHANRITAEDIGYQWHWQLGRIFSAQGQRERAITAYTQAFASLQSLRRDLAATHPDAQFSFRRSVEPVYRELVDLLLQPSDAAMVTAANLRQARLVIEALQTVELENFFRSACLEGRQVPLDQVKQPNTAVLYPIVLADRLEVILELPDQSLHHYATPISQAQVRTIVDNLRRSLEEPITSPDGQMLGAQVYDWLVRPVQQLLRDQQVQTLVFVLDGPLRNIPMAALYDGQHYLMESYKLALTPGLQLLSPRPLQTQRLKVLAAGLAKPRHGLPALKYVRTELEQIDAIAATHILLNEKFTTDNLQDRAHHLPFPVIHLATHGRFSSRAEGTYLSAWDKRIPVGELYDLLRSSEQTRPDPIELLILSACQTANGDEQAALGLAGVAIQAGARSTLASLWNLDDQSGAQFMTAFYRAIQHSSDKAEALQQAQLSLLKSDDFDAPRFWAPYVLVGNWL